MKRKIITLWMVIFPAAVFFVGPIILYLLVRSRIMSGRWDDKIIWASIFIFILSPLAALFLGLCGALPGTKPLTDATNSTNATLTVLSRIAIILAALFAFFMWVAFQPPAGRPNVSITFLGYTNDNTGNKLAKIVVTNLNTSTVYAYAPRVEIPSPTDPAGLAYYQPDSDFWWCSLLDNGASDDFVISNADE